MSQYGVYFNYLIVIAVGFAVSGAVSSFYQLVTSERADFMPFSMSPMAVMVAFLLSMFAGPFIIASKIWTGLTRRNTRAPLVALLLVICGLWSFYSGFFVLYLTYTFIFV